VTLEGTVGSAKEKRIVEGMVRMTPGVRAVFNRLQISETLPAPKTGAPPIGQ
jgi:osmotically-inducible protein OsmY